MELTEQQKTAVAGWVREGDGLSEIQKRLRSEFDISMTYMDVRFLIIDLGLTLKEDEPPKPKPKPKAPPSGPVGPLADQAGAGGVSVEVDRLVKPGAVVSGSVTFGDGRQATWMLDQLGRLALDAGDPDYRPSEQDLAEFQSALRDALQQQGF